MRLVKAFIIGFIVPLLLCFSAIEPSVLAQEDSALTVINQYIEALNQKKMDCNT